MNEFQRMQLILQLKTIKWQMIQACPNMSVVEINSMMKNDSHIHEIMERCGVIFV